MNIEALEKKIKEYAVYDKTNFIGEGIAMSTECVGLRIFDEPLIGYASADDDIILSLVQNEEANMDIKIPTDWLPTAKTVISLFLPYTESIRVSNRGGGWPSNQWLHGRIEGHVQAENVAKFICEELKTNGYDAIVPAMDPSFEQNGTFTSNWSERHIAYAAGLGTFSLSKGLISEKGVSGRYISIVTSMEIEPTERSYTKLTEYCTMCGKCVTNCPVDAISIDEGKSHEPCAIFLRKTKAELNPYYGCGKCQCDVPCEASIPGK